MNHDAETRTEIHNAPLLQVEKLQLAYSSLSILPFKAKPTPIIEDVSFILKTGETFALLGRTGAGKSSILQSILGFLRPLSGRILVMGVDIWRCSARYLRILRPLIQPIFQDPTSALNPSLTVGQAIQDGLRLLKLTRSQTQDRLRELFTAVQLDPSLAGYYPTQLSVGQQQRIVLARALAPRPRLLLLDEPFSALDAVTTQQIIELLWSLRKKYNLSWLLVTHDLRIARLLAATGAVLHQGRIIETGALDALLNVPSHPFTRQLVAACFNTPEGQNG